MNFWRHGDQPEVDTYDVREITREDCRPFIIDIHYAKRYPSVSFAYGLFRNKELVGVITYGKPFSPTLREGIAGEEYIPHVLELNRLVLKDNLKNEASRLIAASIKMLPKPQIIISFADPSHGHVGWVYQATNFRYYGLSAIRTDWAIRGDEHRHGTSVGDEFRGQPNRVELLKEKYGDAFYLKPRPRKHRYIYLHGSRKWVAKVLKDIKYTEKKYPK
jgi:hypothetical protein